MVLSAAKPENICERVREPANLNPQPGPFPPPPDQRHYGSYAVRNGAAQADICCAAAAATVAAKAKAKFKAAVESFVASSAAASVAKPAAARKNLHAKRSLPQNNVPDNAVDDFAILRSCSKQIRSKKTRALMVIKCECH